MALVGEDSNSRVHAGKNPTRSVADALTPDETDMNGGRNALDRQLHVLSQAAAVLRNLRAKRTKENQA